MENNNICSLPFSDLQNSIHQNIYGKSLAITNTEPQLSATIIENPEMLKYQQERQSSAQANSGSGGTGAESSTPKVNSVVNGESLEDIRKVTSNKRQNFDFVNMLVLIGLAQTQYKYFNINLQGSILCCIVLYYII